MTDEYYKLCTVNRFVFILDIAEGDRVGTILDALKDNYVLNAGMAADPMFVTFTDRSGSEIRVRTAHIEALFTSTPASRDADKVQAEKDKDWSAS